MPSAADVIGIVQAILGVVAVFAFGGSVYLTFTEDRA